MGVLIPRLSHICQSGLSQRKASGGRWGALHGEGEGCERHGQSKGSPLHSVSSASSLPRPPGFMKLSSIQPTTPKLLLLSQPSPPSFPCTHESPLSGGPCCPHCPGSLLAGRSVLHTQAPALRGLKQAESPTLSTSVPTPNLVPAAAVSTQGRHVQLLQPCPRDLSSCFWTMLSPHAVQILMGLC